jgi:hypothetical protein
MSASMHASWFARGKAVTASGVNHQRGFEAFSREADALHGLVTSTGVVAAWDGQVRLMYQTAIRSAIEHIRSQALSGAITWHAAADQAQQLRNELLGAMRARSSSLGVALAQWMKSEGLGFNALVARYTVRLYGSQAAFTSLSAAQQQRVFAEIVEAAARSRPVANSMGQVLRIGGRSLFLIAVAVSLYEVATSTNPARTAAKEVAVLGAGLGGSVAGGALAGLACGPGAPVCVAIGAFVGGAMFALGASAFFH